MSSRPAWSTENKFQDSQGYTEKPYLEKPSKSNQSKHPHLPFTSIKRTEAITPGQSTCVECVLQVGKALVYSDRKRMSKHRRT